MSGGGNAQRTARIFSKIIEGNDARKVRFARSQLRTIALYRDANLIACVYPMNERIHAILRGVFAPLIFSFLLVSCDEDVLGHTCDESKELRFTEFGDAAGYWEEMDQHKFPACANCLSSFRIKEDGVFEIRGMGCYEGGYPLVPNDYNGVVDLGFAGKLELVRHTIEPGYIRLDYNADIIYLLSGEIFDKDGFIEFRRVGPDRIDITNKLPYQPWFGRRYKRVEPDQEDESDDSDNSETML